ncbi:MAG: exodeoxyribonuclease VII small subunit [Acidaminococcaceae bacterium]|nr:exodeoxyribonuclease VII small subunit [Acidaminococcaceae bacterium]
MAVKKIAKNIKFETAMDALEEEVRLLESGELSLEDALESFKRGVELSKICMSKLTVVKQEVSKITLQDGVDGYRLETFEEPEE